MEVAEFNPKCVCGHRFDRHFGPTPNFSNQPCVAYLSPSATYCQCNDFTEMRTYTKEEMQMIAVSLRRMM